MLGDSNRTTLDVKDSFFDEQEDTTPIAKPIQSIHIVSSKPPVYRQETERSNSLSDSSIDSDHDVTDVSSIGGEHHHNRQQQSQFRQQQKENDEPQHRRQSNRNEVFQLHSMKNVLFGSTALTSRPPSPAHPPSPEDTKKHVRIITDDNENFDHDRPRNRNHKSSQPYIHGYHRDQQRVRLTSSAINRQKQQQRIERENLKILDRLQKARATNGLKRDELLSHYDRQIGYVTYPTPSPTTSVPHRTRSSNRPSSAMHMSPSFTIPEKKSTQFNRPSSASQSVNSNSVRSRPVSAPTSLHGSSRSSSRHRPVWNDRWQTNQE